MTISEKLTQIAVNEQKVYDAGYQKGKSEGGDTTEAFEQGRKAEYNDFWDAYQQNGNKTSYTYAFAKEGWNNGTFKPKYPIIAVGDASYMFDSCGLVDFDFVENGIEMDLSSATSLTYIFRECKGIKRLGVIDCNGCKNLNRLFYSCKVVTIDKFIVNENITYSNTFDYASALENITVEGVIGQNGINVSFCPLTHDSLMSIINALKDGVSGLTCTLGEANLAKLTFEEKMIAISKGWDIGAETVSFVFENDGERTYHEFVEGMTWAQWCDSMYNTLGLYITDLGAIYCGVSGVWDVICGEAAFSETKIHADHTYIVQ